MASSDSEAIRLFHLSIPRSALDDLQTRLRLIRWPDKETVTDWSQGAPLATVQDLVRYWQTSYSWKPCEDLLNSYPQFTTTIDGVEIYFIHLRSDNDNALPLLFTHGWPGSVLEFLEGMMGQPYGGFPEPLRSKALRNRRKFDKRPGLYLDPVDFKKTDRKSTRLNSSHSGESRMPSSA